MYQSPQLEDGLHTLSVSAPNTTIGVPSTQFAFDYLTYVPSPSSSNSTSSPPATSSQSGQSQSSNLHVTLPAVLVPTLVCIALLVIALLIQRRRSTDYRRSSEERMEKLASASQIDSGKHLASGFLRIYSWVHSSQPTSRSPNASFRSAHPPARVGRRHVGLRRRHELPPVDAATLELHVAHDRAAGGGTAHPRARVAAPDAVGHAGPDGGDNARAAAAAVQHQGCAECVSARRGVGVLCSEHRHSGCSADVPVDDVCTSPMKATSPSCTWLTVRMRMRIDDSYMSRDPRLYLSH